MALSSLRSTAVVIHVLDVRELLEVGAIKEHGGHGNNQKEILDKG